MFITANSLFYSSWAKHHHPAFYTDICTARIYHRYLGKPFPILDGMPCSTLPCPDLHETWKAMAWESSANIIIKITYIRPTFQSDACPSCSYQASEMNRPWQYNERFLWSEKHLKRCKWEVGRIHLNCYLLMWRNIPMVWTQGPTRASEWNKSKWV